MNHYLVINERRTITLKDNSATTVGRNSENDIVIKRRNVSAMHCTITVDEFSQAFICDGDGIDGSTNGTYLNGVKLSIDSTEELKKCTRLRHGDAIKVGSVLIAYYCSQKANFDETLVDN